MKTSILLLTFILCSSCNDSKEKAKTSSEIETPSKIQETSTGKEITVDSEDTKMNAAMQKARDTFCDFWDEVSADNKRVIPILEGTMVKAYFVDPDETETGEHLWISDFSYDGKIISGTIASQPLREKLPQLNEEVTFPLKQLTDWLIISENKVKGAYTIQVLRTNMSETEREEHDANYPFTFPPLE